MRDSGEVDVTPRPNHVTICDVPVACVELDRYCEDCGYNLRTLTVTRDERTGIPIVRCTECGRYQPANNTSTALKPLQQRISMVLLFSWMMAIVGLFVLLGSGEGAISYGTLEELTVREGYEFRQISPTTKIVTNFGRGPLQVQADYQYYGSFVTLILFGSFATAFAGGVFAVVVLPHWSRGPHIGLALAIPLIAGAIAAIAWWADAPHLLGWGLQYLGAHAVVQLVGGFLGVTFGRALARTAVSILLPPSIRPWLAYLWIADNKPVPGPRTLGGEPSTC